MKNKAILKFVLYVVTAAIGLGLFSGTAAADTRLIVRDSLGLNGLNLSCLLLGCKVQGSLGDPQGQLFLVTFPSLLDPITCLLKLDLQLGIVSVELDQTVHTSGADAGPPPPYLTDEAPVAYYGSTVWHGYVTQPAVGLISLNKMRTKWGTTGANVIVADIDTGVDVNHPVLKPVLVAGYDFTRNAAGGNETGDVSQSTAAVVDSSAQPAIVNQSTAAVVDQSTAAVVDGSQYSAYGHGTMTAGVIHLVAPQAHIMPLKAFSANGTGWNSDVIRAVYYAVGHGARVLNMSFSFATSSHELQSAINYASSRSVISVASAGNDDQQVNVYPAAYPNVIDVASTSNNDIPSTFSNYGAPPVWLPAPGEGVMTTYPGATYAAAWGTSFSAPMVAGTAALLVSTNPLCNQAAAASAFTHGDAISAPQFGHGRLDTYLVVQAYRTSLGLK